MVWRVEAGAQGGVMRLWGLAAETLGLLGVRTSAMTRRELRAEREELERRAGAKLVEADPRLADFILCEAYRNTPESRRAQLGDFLAVRSEFTAASPPVASLPGMPAPRARRCRPARRCPPIFSPAAIPAEIQGP